MKKAESKTVQNKNVSFSGIVLFTILGLLFALMVTSITMSFVSVGVHTPNVFSGNLIKSLVYILLTAIVLVLVDAGVQRGNFCAKDWIFGCFYILIFILLAVYNIFNLYNIIILNIIANVIVGIILSFCGVSIYYNYLKSENNKVKAKASMVVLFALFFTIAGAFILEFIKWLFGLMLGSEPIAFVSVALNVGYATAGGLLLNVIFYLSLVGKKKFINACLVDVYSVK